MTTTPNESMTELNCKAFEILCRELGLARATRVFQQMGIRSGNYTEERKELFNALTNEDVEKSWNTQLNG